MGNSVLLSIIIPAYNCAATLERTVASVINQKCNDYEIIIINDGSKDNTTEICKKLETKYSFIRCISKENTGVADTRNIGIKNAKGKYIAFLDSDDLWDKNYYDQELKNRLENNDTDIFVFSCCFANLDCEPIENINVKNESLKGGDYAAGLFYHSFCAYIFKREFLNNNDIRFSTKLQYGEDEVFRSKALYLAKEIESEDKMSFYYVNNPYSATKMNRNYKQYALQKLQAYYELKNFFFDQYAKRGEELRIKNNIVALYLTVSFKLLPEVGYGYNNLKELAQKEELHSVVDNSGKDYDIYYEYKPLLVYFISHPLRYYCKRRIYGFIHNILGNIKHFLMKIKR